MSSTNRPGVEIDVLSLNDGDLLVVRLPEGAEPTHDLVDGLRDKLRALTELAGKRVGFLVLAGGLTIDQLTAEQVRDLYRRIAGDDGGRPGE
jgi:hypothetical protein